MVHFLYATTGGNTKMVCEWAADALIIAGISATLHRVESENPAAFFGDLPQGDILVLASPTYGHGQLEPLAVRFYGKARRVDLTGRRCAVIGLGHDKYDDDYNVESAAILTDFVDSHGGEMILEPLKINRNPVPQLKEKVTKWANELTTKI